MFSALPPKQGLYDPQFEHDACGVGFVVDIAGRKSNEIVRRSLQVLVNLQHRGAKGCEENTGDGAGILIQIPHEFLKAECKKLGFTLPAAGNYGVAWSACHATVILSACAGKLLKALSHVPDR